ncbi:MAG: hypothetical protein ACIALR_12745 [Blastopirellula sp. JB062]
MSNIQQSATIAELAGKIEADIRQRGLRSGDHYLTTAETARMLHAGTAPTTQALQLLVKRKVIERKQRVGTIVGKDFDLNGDGAELKRVHVLMYDHHLIEEGIFTTDSLFGLQNALPGTHVSFEFVPLSAHEEERYLREIISEALARRGSEGFILFNSTVQIQMAFRDTGLPTVIAGSLYASSQGLSYIDRDQKQLGRLLADYLLSKGRRKILMITRQRPGLGAGDYRVADAIAEKASEAGLSANALIVRSLPHDPKIVRGEIQHFLETCDEVPGILLRPWQMIEPIYEAIEGAGLIPQKDVPVAVADYFLGTTKPLPYPAIRSTMTPEDQGFQWGQLLLESARNASSESKGVLIPVRLEIPAELR